MEWWQRHAPDLPAWSSAVSKMILIQPTSASLERVFSLLKHSFNCRQDNALCDYIESSLFLQYNKR